MYLEDKRLIIFIYSRRQQLQYLKYWQNANYYFKYWSTVVLNTMLRQGCHCAYLLTAMQYYLLLGSCNRLVISFENLDQVGSSSQIQSPAYRCRTGLPAYLAWRAGPTTLCRTRSQLYPPRQGLWIWRQKFLDFSYLVGSKTIWSSRIRFVSITFWTTEAWLNQELLRLFRSG